MTNLTINVFGRKKLIDAQFLLRQAGIAEKMYVADLGCGQRGYFTLQAAKIVGEQGLVYAVDVVKSALKNVESMANLFGFPNIKTIWADLEVPKSSAIPSDSVDISMLNNILSQTHKNELIIKEACRILKKGGKLLITDWKKIKTPFGPKIEDRPDSKIIKQICQKQDLVLEREFEAGPYHYCLIFIKK